MNKPTIEGVPSLDKLLDKHGKCLVCDIPIIGKQLLCASCNTEYPGVVDEAYREVVEEIGQLVKRRKEEFKHQQSVAYRRASMRLV